MCLLLCWACGTGDPPASAPEGESAPAAAPVVYRLSDTTGYQTFNSEGRYALLRAGGELLDTVDLDFGVHRLEGDTVVFLPVSRADSPEPGVQWYAIDEHVLYDGTRRTVLGPDLPGFNSQFSSPAVVGTWLYYWAIDPDGGHLSAARYRFSDGHLDSTGLGLEVLPTDFRFNLRPPVGEAGGIVYQGQGRRFVLDAETFTVEREAPPSGP